GASAQPLGAVAEIEITGCHINVWSQVWVVEVETAIQNGYTHTASAVACVLGLWRFDGSMSPLQVKVTVVVSTCRRCTHFAQFYNFHVIRIIPLHLQVAHHRAHTI